MRCAWRSRRRTASTVVSARCWRGPVTRSWPPARRASGHDPADRTAIGTSGQRVGAAAGGRGTPTPHHRPTYAVLTRHIARHRRIPTAGRPEVPVGSGADQAVADRINARLRQTVPAHGRRWLCFVGRLASPAAWAHSLWFASGPVGAGRSRKRANPMARPPTRRRCRRCLMPGCAATPAAIRSSTPETRHLATEARAAGSDPLRRVLQDCAARKTGRRSSIAI